MKKVYGFGMAALLCASLFVMGCETEAEPDTGGDGPVTYYGTAGNAKYVLTISKSTAAALAYKPEYELVHGVFRSTGTVEKIDGPGSDLTFTLAPSVEGAQTFVARVSAKGITGFSGTIIWEGGYGEVLPQVVTPPEPDIGTPPAGEEDGGGSGEDGGGSGVYEPPVDGGGGATDGDDPVGEDGGPGGGTTDGGGITGGGGSVITDSALVAKWYYFQDSANTGAYAAVYEFTADGKLFIGGEDVNLFYAVSGTTISIVIYGSVIGTATYTISGTTLFISNATGDGLLAGTYYKKAG
jgi:hypothetical protein